MDRFSLALRRDERMCAVLISAVTEWCPRSSCQEWLHDGKGLHGSEAVSYLCFLLVLTYLTKSGSECGIKWGQQMKSYHQCLQNLDHRCNTYFANAPDKPVSCAYRLPGTCFRFPLITLKFGLTVLLSVSGLIWMRLRKILFHSVLSVGIFPNSESSCLISMFTGYPVPGRVHITSGSIHTLN